MEADKLKIAEFLQEPKTCFRIPVYQRNYSWKEENCQELVGDIEKMAGKAKHFIGSIVYLKDNDQDFRSKDFYIIDGQQRLTTITIALIALHGIYKQNDDYRYEEVRDYLININKKDKSETLKLITNKENNIVLNYLFHNNNDHKCPDNLKTNQIYINFMYFNQYFSKQSDEQLEILFNNILKLDIVSIALEQDKGDDPQQIFESLNSTGKKLTDSDLIRNLILMRLDNEKQQEIYDMWQQIEENTTIINDKQIRELQTSDFIRDFLTFKTKIIPIKSQVYVDYKNNFEDIIQDYENLKEHMRELKKFSQYYRSLLRSEHENKEIQEQLMYINKLKTTVSYPFVFSVLDNYKQDLLPKKSVIKILETIQSFVWRRAIVGDSTNALGNIFASLHDQSILIGSSVEKYMEFIVKGLLKNDNFPTDERIENDLKSKNIYRMKPHNRNYLFLKLERHQNKEIVNIDNLDIEHIFPQTAKTHWKKDLSDQDYNFLETKLHTLANLTLVATNSSLGNKNFIDKRDMNDKNEEKGYKFSKLWLNSKLRTYDKWTQCEYEERFQDLYERFINIWDFPQIKNDPQQKTFNLADQFDYKSINIKQIKYNNTLTDCNKDTDFYRFILKEIFENHRDNIVNNKALLKKIGVSLEKNDMSYQPFIDDYYIGTRTNNQVKINQLRYLFAELKIPLISLEITIE